MSIERVEEVPFVTTRRKRTKLGEYWAIMGYIFQLIRQIDPQLKYLIDTFTLIGLIWTLRRTAGLLGSLFNGNRFRTFIWSRLWHLNLRKIYGQYAVITGATDGIGLEYAKEFARRGHSLILIGRSKEKLDRVRSEISTLASSVNIVTIVADFNNSNPELYYSIKDQLKNYESQIGILVNNAGVMFESPNRYIDQNEDMVWQNVRVNIVGVLMMTRAVLPGMIARRRGLIVNMSSIACYKPLPLMGVYSASKKFVEYFGKTLEYEYGKSHNIHVQTLAPSYISTKMVKWSDTLQRPGLICPNAETFAKSAIATIGRSSHTTGYWSHGLQWFLYDVFVPDWLWTLSSWHVLRGIDSTPKKC
ncbi:hydroxysteroid dehydrogenase-like protein 3 [Dinothrombium tinctorium]|uniref:Hydroxysteroid dehydrogenase-like protein 3 n=1 Tax=Dinothrombium tinctorium TaxID=1965070 RepID=A0A3S3RVQ2_9ACAR|nr:hydroxysteroid dehydrogenase-like protein 3 [Dinothrombium tinctorium]RWS05451.1 hydroxysteroid dehydrogenase-like protein 3 [Dinothrombium tinctorium]